MTSAERIVEALLEDEPEKPKKKLPPWLAKLKGEPVEDEDDDEKTSDEPAKKESSKGSSGGSSSSSVGKTW